MKAEHCLCFLLSIATLNINQTKAQDTIIPSFLLQTSNGVNGGYVRTTDIAYTNKDYVYATGYFTNTADFAPGPDTFNLDKGGSFVAKYDDAYKLAWAFNIPGATVSSVVSDQFLNVYVTGFFSGVVDFDPGPKKVVLNERQGYETDIFFAKYNADGKLVFVKQIGGYSSQYAAGIAVDDSLNIYLTGSYKGDSTDFDPGPGKVILPHDYQTDIFFAKYDAKGNYVYAKGIKGSYYDDANSITLDKDRNIIIAGTFNSHTTDFDPGPGVKDIAYHGNVDAFIAKYDNEGNYIFAFAIGGISSENGNAVTTDTAGNIFITGLFYQDVDFDPLPGATHQTIKTSNGLSDIFLAKYSPEGALLFVNTIGGSDIDIGKKVKTDTKGNVYITGTFTSKSVDFNTGSGVDTLSAISRNSDLFFACYDGAGNYIYAKQISGYGTKNTGGLLVNAKGNVLLTASFNLAVDADPGPGIKKFKSTNGLDDSFIAQYTSKGDLIGGTAIEQYRNFDCGTFANRITYDKQRNIYVVGQYQGIIDFDPGHGTYYLTSKPDEYINGTTHFGDIFFAKYSPDGNFIFAKSVSGPQFKKISAFAIDDDTNIYLCGTYQDSTDFDPGDSVLMLHPKFKNGYANFIAKYNAQGNLVFAEGIDNDYDAFSGIALDKQKNIYITGSFSKCDFDPGPGIAQFTSKGYVDMFFACYDSSGKYKYCKQIGLAGNNSAYGTDIQVSNSNTLAITGYYSSSADFNPGAGNYILNSGKGTAHYVAGYTLTGDLLFASTSTCYNNGYVLPAKIALDKESNIYVTGSFHNKADFDPGADTSFGITDFSHSNMFYQKFDAKGNYVFTKIIKTRSSNAFGVNISNSVYVDNYNYIYLTGNILHSADFDPGPGKAYLGITDNEVTSYNTFLAKYDSMGNYVSAYDFLQPGRGGYFDEGNDLYVNNFGEIILAGRSNADVNLGVGEDTVFFHPNDDGYDGRRTYDFFIMQYLQPDFCAIADSLYANNITANSALLHWRYPNPSQSFKIYYKPADSKTWLITTGIGLSKRINNLKPDTKYEWKLFASCSSDTSVYSETAYFKTKASALFANDDDLLYVNEEKAALSIYPNPAKNKVNISLLKGNIQSVKITDAGGATIYNSINLKQPSVDINLNNAASGTYMLSVFDGSKTFNKKLIIEK